MKNRDDNGPDQVETYDPATGEVMPPLDEAAEMAAEQELFGDTKEGLSPDGSTVLPKMTMATMRAGPERAKTKNAPIKIALITGMAGSEFLMPPIDRQDEIITLDHDHPEFLTFSALVATIDPWGAVIYDDDGEPDRVYKSDYLFLPIGHRAAIQRLRLIGQVPLALEFWAQPANNRVGYSWYYHNLAKYDRQNISAVDRLLRLGVHAGRALLLGGRQQGGLLSDLRK